MLNYRIKLRLGLMSGIESNIYENQINHLSDLDDEIPYEPRHETSNNVVCATSKASDQPAHTRSLIRAFACCLNIL